MAINDVVQAMAVGSFNLFPLFIAALTGIVSIRYYGLVRGGYVTFLVLAFSTAIYFVMYSPGQSYLVYLMITALTVGIIVELYRVVRGGGG